MPNWLLPENIADVLPSEARKIEDLRRACARLPFGARALAVVAQHGLDSPELRRIADADVVTVGALDQLPVALQRVLA